jgi:FkbM family methyltransferase
MPATSLYRSVRNRLNSSAIRRAYWTLANREALISSQREEDFYRKLLVDMRHGDLIFDVGANVGAKTEVFLRLGARVIAVEPEDACLEALKDRFVRYRFSARPVTLIGKAVSEQLGSAKLYVDGPSSAVNTISERWASHLKENKNSFKHEHCGLDFARTRNVETTTLESLIHLYGEPFFIKIDVEGHELSVLRGLRRPVRFLSFEVNLSVFRREGIECVKALQAIHSNGRFNYTPDCGSGLVLQEWLESNRFCAALDACSEETIEVFWKSNHRVEPIQNKG